MFEFLVKFIEFWSKNRKILCEYPIISGTVDMKTAGHIFCDKVVKATASVLQENFNLKHIINAPDNSTHPKIVSEKERQKSLKKRCKKLKQRMNTRGLEYETSLSGKQTSFDSDHRAK